MALVLGLGMCLTAAASIARAESDSDRTTQTAGATQRPLFVGWAAADITPERPVNLVGQMGKRIARTVLDPITVTALALETRDAEGKAVEQAILVSCDVCMTYKEIQERMQKEAAASLPDFNTEKLFLNATHTHTAPGFLDGAFKGLYDVSGDPGVMKESEYADFFLARASAAVAEAWRGRKPGGVSWGLGHAAVGRNRRARYFDGSARMYGNTAQDDFAGIEGGEDDSVGMLFFWGAEGDLTGLLVNVACPAQETEALCEISADYWHDARLEIRKRLSAPGLFILPQCAAAGDISPHLLLQAKAEAAMLERRGLTSRQEIARRIANAVEDVLPVAKKNIETRLAFEHQVVDLNLPEKDPPAPPFYLTDPVDPIEFHVLRLGDAAIATNPFELYLEYGIQIKARCRAPLTLLVQLSCQNSGYLPTPLAVSGGGYSADNYAVGPEGGRVLVDETVRRINALWP